MLRPSWSMPELAGMNGTGWKRPVGRPSRGGVMSRNRGLLLFAVVALVVSAPVARASEVPGLRLRRIALTLTTERGYAPMPDWNEGIEQLETLARARRFRWAPASRRGGAIYCSS